MGLNYDYLIKRWGFASAPEFAPTVLTISTTTIQAVNQNADRLLLLFQNIGDNDIYVLDSAVVSSTNCMLIEKNGGYWEMPIEWYGEFITHEFFVKGAGASYLYIVAIQGIKKWED